MSYFIHSSKKKKTNCVTDQKRYISNGFGTVNLVLVYREAWDFQNNILPEQHAHIRKHIPIGVLQQYFVWKSHKKTSNEFVLGHQ